MFYLKMPSVAQTNFLRERTDSIVVSALPKRNHDAHPASSNQINDENDEVVEQSLRNLITDSLDSFEIATEDYTKEVKDLNNFFLLWP